MAVGVGSLVGIDTSGLGGQGWRRREESRDAAGPGARRWVVRAGLVLAAGAAGLAMTAGSASADSGLSGTLDHVSSTVKKVTGSGSSHSSSAKASSSSRSSKTSFSSSHRSSSVTVSSQRDSVRKAVVRPVVRPVVRSVNRVTKPVVRVVRVESAHEKRVARQAAEKKAQKKRVEQVDRAVSSVSKTVLHAASKPAPAAVVSVTLDVSKTTKALADVTSAVVTPTSALDLPVVLLPDLGAAVDVPAVDLTVVKLPPVEVNVGLPAAGVDVPGVITSPDLPALPTAPSDLSSAVHVSSPAHPSPQLSAPVLVVSPAAVAPIPVAGASSVAGGEADGAGRVVAHVEAGVSLLAAVGTSGAGVGVGPDGSAQGGLSGLMIFGLAVSAGLAGLKALHARPAHDRSGHGLGLLRQPGFAPD